MSLRNLIQEVEYDVPHGLDTTTPIAAMKPGYVRKALNVDIGYSGGYVKRDGYTNQLSSVWTGRSVTYGIEYKTTTGLDRTVLFGTTGLSNGGTLGYRNGTSVTAVATGLSGTSRPTLTQFNDLLFLYNGVNSPLLYDGTTTREVGIVAPATAPSVNTQTTGGDLTLLGSYVFSYTYYNSVTHAESSPSPFTDPIQLTGANDAIVFNVIAGDPAYGDILRMYRTFANTAGPLYLDGEVSIASTSYTSTVSDSGLGQEIELDNSRIQDLTATANFATNIQNRIFVKSANNEVRWSKVGQSGPMPESFEIKATTRTVARFGSADDIVGINKITQLPIVLKQRSIGRLDQVGIPDNGQSFDNVIFQYSEISDVHGAVSEFAAVQVRGELIYLGKENIYATDGVNVRTVGDAIKATVRTLGFTDLQAMGMSAANDIEKSKVYISVFSSPLLTSPDMVLVGDYQMYPEFRWTFYSVGSNSTTWPGIQAGCFFSVVSPTSGAVEVHFGNSLKNGKYYKMNVGDNDDGSPIYMYMQTRPYTGDSPLKVKLWKLSELQVQGNGGDYDLTVCSIFDLSGTEELCVPFNLDAGSFLYDAPGSVYDTATYSDDSVLPVDYNMHRRAKFMQLVFKQFGADEPIDLFAWGVASSTMGVNGK